MFKFLKSVARSSHRNWYPAIHQTAAKSSRHPLGYGMNVIHVFMRLNMADVKCCTAVIHSCVFVCTHAYICIPSLVQSSTYIPCRPVCAFRGFYFLQGNLRSKLLAISQMATPLSCAEGPDFGAEFRNRCYYHKNC